MKLKNPEKLAKKYQGTLVLGCDKVYRLHGYEEGTNEDPEGTWVLAGKSPKLERWSELIAWIPLKEFLPRAAYKELLRVWNLNHRIQAK